MALIDRIPFENTFDFMVGAVAFERAFAEIYHLVQKEGALGPAESYEAFTDGLQDGDTLIYKAAQAEIVRTFGGCGLDEMENAMRGLVAEAAERFVRRATEAQIAHTQGFIKGMGGDCDDVDPATTFQP